jgi:hypothetical protein
MVFITSVHMKHNRVFERSPDHTLLDIKLKVFNQNDPEEYTNNIFNNTKSLQRLMYTFNLYNYVYNVMQILHIIIATIVMFIGNWWVCAIEFFSILLSLYKFKLYTTYSGNGVQCYDIINTTRINVFRIGIGALYSVISLTALITFIITSGQNLNIVGLFGLVIQLFLTLRFLILFIYTPEIFDYNIYFMRSFIIYTPNVMNQHQENILKDNVNHITNYMDQCNETVKTVPFRSMVHLK